MAKVFKKPLFWVQKALDVLGERTSLPNKVDDLVRPNLDSLGWTRLEENQLVVQSSAGAATIVSVVCPEDTLRLILGASVHHTDVTGPPTYWLWLEKRFSGPASTNAVGLTMPSAPVPAQVKQSLTRPAFLTPGDALVAKSDVAIAAGNLVMIYEFFDLELGEYVPGTPGG